VGKRDGAGSEVVDGGGDFEALELAECAGGEVRIRHCDAFGDLQLKSAGCDLDFAQAGFDAVQQLRAGEVTGGEVDGDAQAGARAAGTFLDRQVAAGLPDHPLIDQGHQTGIFGGFEELVGGDEALFGMLPAQQGFEADDLAGMDLKGGLIEDAKLATVEGGAQIGFDLEAGDGAIVHSGIEELGAASTHGLGAAQGGLGVAQRIVGSLLLGGTKRNSNTEGGANRTLVEDQGSGHGSLNALGDAENVTGVGAGFE
jgi:hypothetical protein